MHFTLGVVCTLQHIGWGGWDMDISQLPWSDHYPSGVLLVTDFQKDGDQLKWY